MDFGGKESGDARAANWIVRAANAGIGGPEKEALASIFVLR